jgi:hypothetical protein
MYVDDELSAADRKAVENFIQQHPDLEEELVMLQQSVLRADEHIVFEQKELLFKNSATPILVNENNYEQYFVLYGDDELTNEEKDRVELFVYKHPQYQAEFELIQQVKLVPDNTLTFPDKAYLYRTEEDDSRIVAFPWWRLTAAAITLLVIGGLTWYNMFMHIDQPEVAITVPATKSSGDSNAKPVVAAKNNKEEINSTPANEMAVVETPVSNNPARDNKQPGERITQNDGYKKNISKPRNIQQAVYVQQKSKQQPVPTAVDNEKSFPAQLVDVALGKSYERPVVKTAIVQQTISEPIAINTVAEKTENEIEPTYVLNTSINKTPLRGFFRKVSRVVDKVTGDDNGKGGIRIANLEIALK